MNQDTFTEADDENLNKSNSKLDEALKGKKIGKCQCNDLKANTCNKSNETETILDEIAEENEDNDLSLYWFLQNFSGFKEGSQNIEEYSPLRLSIFKNPRSDSETNSFIAKDPSKNDSFSKIPKLIIDQVLNQKQNQSDIKHHYSKWRKEIQIDKKVFKKIECYCNLMLAEESNQEIDWCNIYKNTTGYWLIKKQNSYTFNNFIQNCQRKSYHIWNVTKETLINLEKQAI